MKPLGALMAVLVALLGWESLPASGDPTEITSAVTPVIGVAPPEAPAPVAAWTNVILGRPLFAQDRRPKLSAAATPSRSAAPEELPRLAGTIRSNNILMAIFAPAGLHSAGAAAASPVAVNARPGGPIQGGTPPERTPPDVHEKPIVVGRDGIVAGWTVVDIVDAAVTLGRAGRTVTLRLSYANQPAPAHAAAPEALVLLHDKRTNPFLQP